MTNVMQKRRNIGRKKRPNEDAEPSMASNRCAVYNQVLTGVLRNPNKQSPRTTGRVIGLLVRFINNMINCARQD
jgi:hypothetical protein